MIAPRVRVTLAAMVWLAAPCIAGAHAGSQPPHMAVAADLLSAVTTPRAGIPVRGAHALPPRTQAQTTAAASSSGPSLAILDVPFLSQTELLCGGAAAAMVLRYWGERGIDAQAFAPLVDRSAAGIRTDRLIAELRRRGWTAAGIAGSDETLDDELRRGRPVMALVEDRRGVYHYVVVVAATADQVVYHDPARAPFRVTTRERFTARWARAGRWMAVIVPGAGANADTARTPIADGRASLDAAPSATDLSCDGRVASAVGLAQRGDIAAAERTLVAALSCPGPAAARELAGVRVLQERWPDVAELATTAVERDPHDEYAWRLLATARFVQKQPIEALRAWNAIGEPKVDVIRVDGLTRTRQRVVEQLIGVNAGDVLTPARLAQASRELGDLPAAFSSRLAYVPVSGGLAELHAHVFERPAVPRTAWSYAGIALSAAASREVAIRTGALSGGGESLSGFWRFWPKRPAIGASVRAPAPWGGVWSAEIAWQEQPFDVDGMTAARRTSARLELGKWVSSRVRIAARAGLDRWREHDAQFAAGGTLRVTSADERADVRVDGDAWSGAPRFGTVAATLRLRSRAALEGLVVAGTGALAWSSDNTPTDLWPAGDTGHARPILLRAHPVLDDGALRVERLGRTLIGASGELQRWWSPRAPLRVGAAAFIDVARTSRRSGQNAVSDVDLGVGGRFAVPGISGLFRVDVATGLRDGDKAVSFVWVP